jgi:GT2 family glycosyltransferase
MSASDVSPAQRCVDVVIVHYETPELLDGCLQSITAHGTSRVCDVIVVDNSRTREDADRVVAQHSAVRLVRPPTNGGYGDGANRGVAAGTGHYVLVLNADCEVHAGAVEALVAELDAHPDTAIIGPRLVDPDGRVQPSCAHFPSAGRVLMNETGLWKLVRRMPIGERAKPFFEPRTASVVPWVLGAALAVQRQAFEDVGGFDEGYFMYYEEVDLSRRLAARGLRTRFTPHATVGHVGGASTTPHRAAMQRQMFRSLARYMRNHSRDQRLVRLRAVVLAIATARLARDVVASTGSIGPRSRQAANEWRALVGDALRGWRDA